MLLLLCCPLSAGDWPQWRYDAARSASSPEQLPEELHLQWVRQYPPQETAWPQQVARGYMLFDVSYKPVVAGKLMFVSSAANHRLTALSTETGKEVWRFYADGPIRLAPVCGKGKVYFISDDGWLYCLDAAEGTLEWRYRGGADGRKILGSGHLVSLWPARGGPALADGKIYFGASIWPFMGSFLHAVDAETGKPVWVNSGTGAQWKASYSLQGSGMLVRPGMYGTVAQGYLVVADNRLGVPQGRNVAQMFDRATGELMFNEIYGMHVEHNSTDYWFALTSGRSIFSGPMGSAGTSIDTGKMSYRNPIGHSITDAKVAYRVAGNTVAARNPAARFAPLWSFNLPAAAAVPCPGSYIKAGKNLYIPGANGQLLIVKDVDAKTRATVAGPKLPAGGVWDMLAADGRLFVVTRDGKIACYGGTKVDSPPTLKDEVAVIAAADETKAAVDVGKKIGAIFGSKNATDALKKVGKAAQAGANLHAVAEAKAILKLTGDTGGYCLVLHLQDGALAEAMVHQSKMKVIVVEEDDKPVKALRRKMDAAGLYGNRLSAHTGVPLSYGLPSYLAEVIVSERRDAAALVAKPEKIASLFAMLRPYTGKLVVPMGETTEADLQAAVAKAKLYGAKLEVAGGYAVLHRTAPLEGAADWSHNNADAGNAMANTDKVARPPLGVLWFGGPPNTKILPRHGRGPAPAVSAGQLYIEGRDILRAIDIYTGRLLWEREFKDIGSFYDTGSKQLGTHETGPNYCATPDAVYVISPAKCLELSAETGKTLKEFALPAGVEKDSLWATVRVSGDWVVATIRPMDLKRGYAENTHQGAGGKWLAAFNRKTGKNLWVKKSSSGWRGNGVAVGSGKVFAIDGLTTGELKQAKKRGVESVPAPVMYAFDAAGGKELWKTDQDVFGTWLGYSSEYEVLVQAGCGFNDPTFLAGHAAADGKRLWRNPPVEEPKAASFIGPPMIVHDNILPQYGTVVGLKDGKVRMILEPLNGRAVPWGNRSHGCGFSHAGEYMTFHRAWSTGGFTEHRAAPRMVGLGGFRSGCTANMIPAGGVVAVPEYTRDCECQFKNKASLGLIHMPDASSWSVDLGPVAPEGRIARVGLNFGAPADRMSDEGTLWLDCPDIGGPSPKVTTELLPAKDGYRRNWVGSPHWRKGKVKFKTFGGPMFRHHATRIKAGPLRWVTGSGLIGVESVKAAVFYPIDKAEKAHYTVRLYFADPEGDAKAGDRVFTVKLQGKDVLKDLDVAKEAGGGFRGIVKEIKGVSATDFVTLEFSAKTGKAIISGLEILAEK